MIMNSYRIAMFGVQNLVMYQHGFINPMQADLGPFVKRDRFIPYSSIDRVYTNSHMNRMLRQKTIAIILKERGRTHLIDVTTLRNRHEFLRVLGNHVRILDRDLHYKCEFFSPKHRIEIRDGYFHVVRGKVTFLSVPMEEIKAIGFGHTWLVKTHLNDYSFGIFDYPWEERKILKQAFKAFRTGKEPFKLPEGEKTNII